MLLVDIVVDVFDAAVVVVVDALMLVVVFLTVVVVLVLVLSLGLLPFFSPPCTALGSWDLGSSRQVL